MCALEDFRMAVGHELSDIGQRTLEAYFDLPGLENWTPGDQLLGSISRVFDIGLPFALIGDLSTAVQLKRITGHAIAQGNFILPSEWSEIQVGALMRSFGAKVEFVKRVAHPPGKRTPDLRTSWAGTIVDVEVTRAETRELHRNVTEGLAAMVGAVQATDQDWHILALYADAGDQESLADSLEALMALRPDRSERACR